MNPKVGMFSYFYGWFMIIIYLYQPYLVNLEPSHHTMPKLP